MSNTGFFPNSNDHTKLLALSSTLRPILPLRISPEGQYQTWYQGGEPYFDFFINYLPPMNLVWFEFTLRGKFVEWRHQPSSAAFNNLRTGDTNEYEQSDWQPASKLLNFDKHLNLETIKVFLEILNFHPQNQLFSVAKKYLQTCQSLENRGD